MALLDAAGMIFVSLTLFVFLCRVSLCPIDSASPGLRGPCGPPPLAGVRPAYVIACAWCVHAPNGLAAWGSAGTRRSQGRRRSYKISTVLILDFIILNSGTTYKGKVLMGTTSSRRYSLTTLKAYLVQ